MHGRPMASCVQSASTWNTQCRSSWPAGTNSQNASSCCTPKTDCAWPVAKSQADNTVFARPVASSCGIIKSAAGDLIASRTVCTGPHPLKVEEVVFVAGPYVVCLGLDVLLSIVQRTHNRSQQLLLLTQHSLYSARQTGGFLRVLQQGFLQLLQPRSFCHELLPQVVHLL